MQVILASSSIHRLQLLHDVGVMAIAVAADIDESSIIGDTPIDTAILRARQKTDAVHQLNENSMVIGADQVCYLGGILMGKPTSEAEWFDRLRLLRGKDHLLSTAVCIAIADSSERLEFVETTRIRFRGSLTDEELRGYVKLGEAKYCAGGYMMEKRGAWLIESIQGDWQNVIGLPIFPLLKHLKELGVPCFGGANVG